MARLATPLAQLPGYVGPAQPLGHRAAGGVGEAEVQGAGTRLGTIEAESGHDPPVVQCGTPQ